MYGRIEEKNEISMRWFDIYFTTCVPILAVARGLLGLYYILCKDFESTIGVIISALINTGIYFIYKPYKKLMVRKYPKSLFCLIMIDNAVSLLGGIITVAAAILLQAYQEFFSTIMSTLPFALNIFYFVKRKSFFGIEKIKTKSKVTEKNYKENQTIEQKATLGVADEIKKYKELLDSGAITSQEFEQKKEQLLNS